MLFFMIMIFEIFVTLGDRLLQNEQLCDEWKDFAWGN